MVRVAVIGAGLSGLMASRRLAEKQDKFSFVTFECSENAGGTWVYTSKLRSEMGKYEHPSPCVWNELRANGPAIISKIPGFDEEESLNDYKHRIKVSKYLNEFVQNFGLDNFIKYNMAVERVFPVKDKNGTVQHWELDIRDVKSDTVKTETFDYVIDCTGRYGKQTKPKIPGLEEFKGIAIHSDDFRDASRFAGMRVVVYGISWSAFDILTNQLLSYPKEICWSYEPKGIYTTIPHIDSCIKKEGIIRKPGISKIEGQTVTFTNGESYEADAIIYCTGFEVVRNFYTPECGLAIEEGRIEPLYKFIFNANHPSLMVIGACYNFLNFSGCDYHVRCALSIIEGTAKLPGIEEMLADIKKTYDEQLERYGHPKRTMSLTGSENPLYYKELSKLGNLEPFPETHHEAWDIHIGKLLENWETFRNFAYYEVDGHLVVQPLD